MFSNRVPSVALMSFCRMVRVGLEAGLPLVEVFRGQAKRGPLILRPIAGRVAERMAAGTGFTEALAPEAARFPPLFVALSAVGDDTGHLPETFRELEAYFEQQYLLRSQFRSQIIWPVIQFVGAIGVITLLLLVLGALGIKMDPLGLGTGPSGAVKFLLIVGGGLALLAGAFAAASRRLRYMAPIERAILKTPALGPALEAVLLNRFCVGLRLTLGAGLAVPRAVKTSLEAAASALYLQSYQKAKPGLRRGEELVEVLNRCRVFPAEFLDVVANGEASGQVPEVMAQQATYYREEAGRRLKTLAQVAGMLVYAAVAVFIIFLIFKLYGQVLGSYQI